MRSLRGGGVHSDTRRRFRVLDIMFEGGTIRELVRAVGEVDSRHRHDACSGFLHDFLFAVVRSSLWERDDARRSRLQCLRPDGTTGDKLPTLEAAFCCLDRDLGTRVVRFAFKGKHGWRGCIHVFYARVH